jgi:hypothetical protein
MPKSPNQKCLECAQSLSRSEAKQVHGPTDQGGDGCWVDNRCDSKRSHYRNRKENNAKQRGQYHAGKVANQAVEVKESIFIPVQAPPVALLYLYRANRKDAHLHAIAVSVWQGNEKLDEVEPVHCMGMTNRQVNLYLREVLNVLGDRYGITEFEPPIRMEPNECPMVECPLKERAWQHSS